MTSQIICPDQIFSLLWVLLQVNTDSFTNSRFLRDRAENKGIISEMFLLISLWYIHLIEIIDGYHASNPCSFHEYHNFYRQQLLWSQQLFYLTVLLSKQVYFDLDFSFSFNLPLVKIETRLFNINACNWQESKQTLVK